MTGAGDPLDAAGVLRDGRLAAVTILRMALAERTGGPSPERDELGGDLACDLEERVWRRAMGWSGGDPQRVAALVLALAEIGAEALEAGGGRVLNEVEWQTLAEPGP